VFRDVADVVAEARAAAAATAAAAGGGGGAVDDDGDQTVAAFTLELAGDNDPPTFVERNVTIDEDQNVDESDEVVVAEAISAGPFEDGVVRFEVAIVDGAELVVGDPAVSADGFLTLTPVANRSGTVRLELTPFETARTSKEGRMRSWSPSRRSMTRRRFA
jgi:hypothetical protein